MSKPKATGSNLFPKLDKMMREGSLYRDSSLTRKRLAEILSTNEKYVCAAIRQNTGMTYTAYITKLRMDHACWLLATATRLSIEDIASTSGIGSRNTLHRLFRTHYSVTPAQFRFKLRSAAEKITETPANL